MKENDPNFTESIFADDAFFEFNEFKNLRKGWYLIIEQFKREIQDVQQEKIMDEVLKGEKVNEI